EASNSAEQPHMELVKIDEDGDLTLWARSPDWVENGRDLECLFLVDSRALRRASPVWKSMLYGGWAEGKPTDGSQWVVSLPEDDPRALKVLLQAAHSKVDDVDEDDPDVLFTTIILVDKYDAMTLIGSWVYSYKKEILNDGLTWHQRAFVAWHLGDAVWFAEACHHLVMHDNGATTAEDEENDSTDDASNISRDVGSDDSAGENDGVNDMTPGSATPMLSFALPDRVLSKVTLPLGVPKRC
ncbi:hypothetical protein QBC35DRAFT_391772, partial [Podospora australis]